MRAEWLELIAGAAWISSGFGAGIAVGDKWPQVQGSAGLMIGLLWPLWLPCVVMFAVCRAAMREL